MAPVMETVAARGTHRISVRRFARWRHGDSNLLVLLDGEETEPTAGRFRQRCHRRRGGSGGRQQLGRRRGARAPADPRASDLRYSGNPAGGLRRIQPEAWTLVVLVFRLAGVGAD